MNLTNIHILSFCNERLDDLKFMHDSLDNLNSKKRPLSREVPENCRRRRTSSYLKHQIPRIHKLMPSRHLLKKRRIDFDKRCRQHRRRPSIIFSQRSLHSENLDKNLWLETHVWHAKRMQMKNIWGFRLSTNNNGRGKRSIGKSLRNSCILHDSSYMRPIQLTGNIANIKELIEQFVDPQCHFLQDPEFFRGQKEIEVLFYKRHHFPKHCIGPVALCCNPVSTFTSSSSLTDSEFPLVSSKVPQITENLKQFPTDRMVWLWAHPSFFSTLLNALQLAVVELSHNISVTSTSTATSIIEESNSSNTDAPSTQVQVQQVPGGMIRFSLRGSTSRPTLQRLLRALLPEPNTASAATNSLGNKARDTTTRNDWLLSLLGNKWDSSPSPWTHGRMVGFTASIEGCSSSSSSSGSSICRKMASSSVDSTINIDDTTVVNNDCDAELDSGSVDDYDSRNSNKVGLLPISQSRRGCHYHWRPDAADSVIWEAAYRTAVRQSLELAKATRNTLSHKAGLSNMSKHHLSKPSGLRLLSPVAVTNDYVAQTAATTAGAGGHSLPTPINAVQEFPILLIRKDSVSRISRQGSDRRLIPSYSCRAKNSLVTPPWYRSTRTARLSGWDLIAPSGVGSVLWQALIFSGSHAVGQREMEVLSLESGVASFPRDYPDTAAGREYWKELAQVTGKGSKRNRWKVEKLSIPWMKLFTADVETEAEADSRETGLQSDHPGSGGDSSKVEDSPFTSENSGDGCSIGNSVMAIDSSTTAVLEHSDIGYTGTQQQTKSTKKKRTRNRMKLWDATGLLVVRGQLYTSAFLVPTALKSTPHADADADTTTYQHTNSGDRDKRMSPMTSKRSTVWCTPAPLLSPPSSLPTLIGVRVWVAGRGVLSAGAQLLAPTGADVISNTTEGTAVATDYQAWMLGLDAVYRKTTSLLGKGNKRLGLWRGVEYSTEEKANDSGRISLGFVTSGDVSVTCGVSIGVGMCNAFLLHKLQREAFYRYQFATKSDLTSSDDGHSLIKLHGSSTSMLVMFHNQRSFWCRPALIEIM